MCRTTVLLATLALVACGTRAPAPPPAPAPAAAPIDLHAQTAAAGLPDDAACLVVRFPDGTLRQSDAERCAIRLRPASTFKLPNALIGADVGLIDGPDAIMHYDPARYPPDSVWNPDWRRDLPLREALAISAVPLFQLLATQIGAARMQAHLDALGYGNHDLSGGIDQFWLKGGLAISATEQVDFLTRLVAGTLPVSARAQEIVRAAAPIETAAGATLHWKTGTGQLDDGTWVGWLVGWIDRPDGPHQFACWIREPGDFEEVRGDRTTVCRGALAALALFPAPVAATAAADCRLDEPPQTVREDGAAVLLRWEVDDRPALWSPALPDDAGYAAFRAAIRAAGAELRTPIADRAPPADAAARERWRREDHNAALVLDGKAGTLRPIHCLEALMFARQHARHDELTHPTEFLTLVLRRGARLRIYFGAGDELFPPKTVYGFDEAAADVAAGWTLEIALHDHTVQRRGTQPALGTPSLSTNDVFLVRNKVADLGLRAAWVTNGVYTAEIPATDLDAFLAPD